MSLTAAGLVMRGCGLVVLVCAAFAACADAGDATRRVVPGGDADIGRTLIRSRGCGTCHVVPGVRGARGTVGPPLTDFGLRGYIAGALPNEPGNLIAWIVNPQAIEPGTVMPNVGVTAAEAAHIAAYLYTLGEGERLGPPHLIPVEALDPLRGGR